MIGVTSEIVRTHFEASKIGALGQAVRSSATSVNYVAGSQLHLDRYGQPSDPFVNLLRLRVREVQAHVPAALMAIIRVEAVTGHESYILSQR